MRWQRLTRSRAGPGGEPARRLGRTWYAERRNPDCPIGGRTVERNIVINTRHDDFANLTVGLKLPSGGINASFTIGSEGVSRWPSV